jgi:hypothetical protein
LLHAWLGGRAAYDAQPFNVIASSHKVGLDALTYALGWHAPSWLFALLTIGCTVAIWRERVRLPSIDQLALLMIVTLTFSTYVHDYDYVAVILPLVVPLWRIASQSRPQAILVLLLLGSFFFPKRFVDLMNIAVLEQWRTLVIIAIGLTIYRHAAVSRPDARAFPPATATT